MNKSAFIVDAIRTPVGKYGGTLSMIRPDDLAALVMKKLMERNLEIPHDLIEDVIFGAANQSGEDNRNVARMGLLLAGLPISIAGVTVNRLCASGLQSIMDASRAIKANEGEVYIAGGVESMTRAPFVLEKSDSAFGRQQKMYDTTMGWRFINPKLSKMYFPFAMGETAENLAEKYQISRLEQDEFAFDSQTKYALAHQNGRFANEIVGVEIPSKKGESTLFDKDEHPRISTLEQLGKLNPAFKANGTVTAGNSSGINDGAAATLIVSEEMVKRYNLTPLARVVSSAVAGVDPAIMGIGPVPAVQKLLKRAGLSINDIDLFELNEAFAAQSIACIRELNIDPTKINVNGGSIAIGHPLGCSGTRITSTLLHEMNKRNNVRYGIATMCIGVGQGTAVLYEKC